MQKQKATGWVSVAFLNKTYRSLILCILTIENSEIGAQ